MDELNRGREKTWKTELMKLCRVAAQRHRKGGREIKIHEEYCEKIQPISNKSAKRKKQGNRKETIVKEMIDNNLIKTPIQRFMNPQKIKRNPYLKLQNTKI